MPTIIDELAMTLKLDPTGFEEGADKAQTASDSLVSRIMASLQKIEQATAATAANTTHIHETAATAAGEAANKAADAQGAAAKRGAHEQEEAGKKAAEAAHKHADEIKEAFDRSAESVKHVAEELLALFGISLSVEAMKHLFETIQDGDEKSGNLAKTIGLNVAALTAWQNAAGRLGSTSEGVTSAMGVLSNEAQAWHYTGKSDLPAQARELFGADIIGPDGEMLQGPELTMALSKGAQAKNMTPEQVAYATRRMNIPGLAAPISAGPEAIQKELDYQKKSGNFTTDEDYKRALELSDALSKVQNSAMGVARVFWRELGPSITSIVERIEHWIDINRDWLNEKATEWGKRLGDFLKALSDDFDKLINGGAGEFATTIGEIAHEADKAAEAMGGWGEAIKLLIEIWAGAKIAGMLTSMLTFASRLGLISAAAGPFVAAIAAIAAVGVGDKLLKNMEEAEAKKLGFQKEGDHWVNPETKQAVSEAQMRSWLGAGPGGFSMSNMPDANAQATPIPDQRTGLGRLFNWGDPGTASIPKPPVVGGGEGGHGGGGHGGGGGGSGDRTGLNTSGPASPAHGALQANQIEAYNAAVGELGETGARAFVANTSGEALDKPGDVHWDGSHYAHGIVQWDDNRAAAIKAQFGKFPQEMTVAEQTRAAIWEMRTNPAYRETYDALRGSGSEESKIRVAVKNYERPRDTEAAVATRLAKLRGLPAQFPGAPTQVAATAPTPAAPAFNFSGTGGNPFMPSMVPSPAAVATVAPTPAPPAPAPQRISMNMGGGEPVGAATGARDYGMSTSNSTIDRSQSSETHVGDVHIHTAATDPRGVAVAFNEGVVKKYDYSRLSDNGLA